MMSTRTRFEKEAKGNSEDLFRKDNERPHPNPKFLLKLAFITIFEDREIIYKSKTLLDQL